MKVELNKLQIINLLELVRQGTFKGKDAETIVELKKSLSEALETEEFNEKINATD